MHQPSIGKAAAKETSVLTADSREHESPPLIMSNLAGRHRAGARHVCLIIDHNTSRMAERRLPVPEQSRIEPGSRRCPVALGTRSRVLNKVGQTSDKVQRYVELPAPARRCPQAVTDQVQNALASRDTPASTQHRSTAVGQSQDTSSRVSDPREKRFE